ncbi:hypothetical protein AB0M97_25350 [Streptomyces sp. NPDC051207]|uniref:hypothetical protein n=1 Tax=Streptomyces sp. NPDC051207 TaxID=3154641 RepID=UPI003427EDF6
MTKLRAGAAALATAAVLLSSACTVGGNDTITPKAGPGASASQRTDPAAGTAQKRTRAGRLGLAADPKLGPIVTDGKGFTLYRFARDTAKPARSACQGECAELWTPVPAEGASLPPGVDAQVLGSLKRSDGTEQLTVAGVPVYWHGQDTEPGQVKGHGVDGAWFATLPEQGLERLQDLLAGTGATGTPALGTPAP